MVRAAADHLRAGGALLTFPAGAIEPDPALRLADALTSLAGWRNATELFVRLVPETAVLLRDRSINPVLSVAPPLRGTAGTAELRAAMEGLLHDCVR